MNNFTWRKLVVSFLNDLWTGIMALIKFAGLVAIGVGIYWLVGEQGFLAIVTILFVVYVITALGALINLMNPRG